MKNQLEVVSLEMLTPEEHTYKKYKSLLNFSKIIKVTEYKKASTQSRGVRIRENVKMGNTPVYEKIYQIENLKDL